MLVDKLPLKQICTIKSGYQGEKAKGEKYKLINPTDLSIDGFINLNNLKTFGNEPIDSKYILKKEQILFKKSKNEQYTTGVFKEESQNCIPSNHFFILTIKDRYKDEILPDYLNYYLKGDQAQNYFYTLGSGMTTTSIKKSDLENLTINIPDRKIQSKIIEIQESVLKEKQLFEKLITLREKQIKSIFEDLNK